MDSNGIVMETDMTCIYMGSCHRRLLEIAYLANRCLDGFTYTDPREKKSEWRCYL